MSEQRKLWLATLMPGDRVAVHSGFRVGTTPAIYTTAVKRRTPTGRIVTSADGRSEQVFRPDGFLLVPARTTYADRHIEPIEGSAKQ